MISNLKLVRIKKGLRQNEVAIMLGIDNSYLCKIENKAIDATPEILCLLAAIYEVSLSELKQEVL